MIKEKRISYYYAKCDKCGDILNPYDIGYIPTEMKQILNWLRYMEWKREGKKWYCSKCKREK